MLVDRRSLAELLLHVGEHEHQTEDGDSEVLIAGDGTRLVAVRSKHSIAGLTSCEGTFSAVLPFAELLEFVSMAPDAEDGPVEFLGVEDNQVVVAIEGRMTTLPSSRPVQPTCAVRTDWSSMEGLEL